MFDWVLNMPLPEVAVRTCPAVSSEDYGNSSGKHLMRVLLGKFTRAKQGLN